ncbi:hypothetical protein HYW35_03730 [Candidatus Saccharibacteria bacterium]|nr:hypothetical protein [Candidatus Saccharibacteria bacterium]
MSLPPESLPIFYQGVVSPEEFLAGTAHAVRLDVLEKRVRNGQELGVLRHALSDVKTYAVEFAPVVANINPNNQRIGWTALDLRWTNLMLKGQYANTPTEYFNRLGLIFNNDRPNRRPGNVSQLKPREILGYVVERDYAKQAAVALDPANARLFRSFARIAGIYIPEPEALAA